MINGRKSRIKNAKEKIGTWGKDIEELGSLLLPPTTGGENV